MTRTRAGRKAGNRYAEAIKALAPHTRAQPQAEKRQASTSTSVAARHCNSGSSSEGKDNEGRSETEAADTENF